MATLAFNSAAQSAFGGAQKVRIRSMNGTLFMRPTARKAGVNLPKGEKLVEIGKGGRVSVDGIEAPAGTFGLQADRYGWFALTPDAPKRGPVVKVAA